MQMLESGFRYTDESTVGQGWFDSAERWTNVQMVHVLEGSAVSYTDCEVDGEAISCLETWTGPIPRAMTGGDWTYRADFILDNPTDGDTWAGVESLHGVALAWPDAAVAMAFYEGMVDWASEVEPELAPVLGTCVIDAGNQDLEVWPVCVEWVERWLEAGRP